jgi:hypothetical protein
MKFRHIKAKRDDIRQQLGLAPSIPSPYRERSETLAFALVATGAALDNVNI